MSGNILILAEIQNGILNPSLYKVLNAVQKLQPTCVDVVVIGSKQHAEQISGISGVSNVFLLEENNAIKPTAEIVSRALLSVLEQKSYAFVVSDASTFGKKVLPRVAVLKDVMQISEVMAIISDDTFVRPLYAGNAIATVKSSDSLKVMTLRSSCFDSLPVTDRSDKASVQAINLPALTASATLVKQDWNTSGRPDLATAKVVLSGGRALGSAENFALLNPCADVLNAAIGATRAAVDSGYISNDHQVGQTGKVVSPELYIGVGVSGAIQHIAGIRGSKVIAAINTDPDAPLCQMADVTWTQDLFTALPELEKKLRG